MISSAVGPRGRLRVGGRIAGALLISGAAARLLLPWYCARGTRSDERRASLPGDDIVAEPETGYTLALTIRAAPSEIWPWIVQMGRGRGGFYTHEWVENLLGAGIQNADRIIPDLQHLAVGDRIPLTPDPYLGRPGQWMLVARIQPERSVVFRQTLPNGATATWSMVLRPQGDGTTRLLSRRRGGQPTLFDRVMKPGYMFMDHGVLRGIRGRVEQALEQFVMHRP
ncbi:MAG TPA: hypothetical protein VIQ74_01130 [Gemmatimonadaceae bacterium]|jgi:hypothetical protein